MSEQLDPKVLFNLIAAHVPMDVKQNILIVGSLAAAYHYRDKLQQTAINTKDADIVIQPAGAIAQCKIIAQRLLANKWRRTDRCWPSVQPQPTNELRAIRLFPPQTDAYFIELLSFPDAAQTENQLWTPCQLDDGWYGLPSFRFLGLTKHDQRQADNGLQYASPAMMALANLLSHPTLGTARMGESIGGRELLRSAKDLGRVLAIARLASRNEIENWSAQWDKALRARFPAEHRDLAARAGNGLRELIEDAAVLDEARHAVDIGLLAGYRVTAEQLKALAQELLFDALEPLRQRALK